MEEALGMSARQKQYDWQIDDLRATVSCLESLNRVESGDGAFYNVVVEMRQSLDDLEKMKMS
eukprot:15341987-Ditylum_brightwellii.AAC.1